MRISFAIVFGLVTILGIDRAAAGGMDGTWSGNITGRFGSGLADIVIRGGHVVSYHYKGLNVPVGADTVAADHVSFGNGSYTMTLSKTGHASFTSTSIAPAEGDLKRY
jgi:hypothetical protein